MSKQLWSLAISWGCLFSATFVCAAEKPQPSLGEFDTTVRPGDDFFQYVNGKWNERNPIPEEHTRWGAFSQLRDENLDVLRQILESLSEQKVPLSGNRKKLRDFFVVAMDEAKLKKQGISKLSADLDDITKLQKPADVVKLIGRRHPRHVSGLFSFWIGQDEKLSTRYVAHLWQGGLGLPERDYYLGNSEDSQRIRKQYQAHVERMLALLGDAPQQATAGANAVLRIETEIAQAARTPLQMRDTEAQYNKKNLKELAALTPDIAWDDYFQAAEITGVAEVVVGQPEFFENLNKLLKTAPVTDWQQYLRWHLIHSTANYLSEEFEREHFRFYEETLRGAKKMQPRWKRVIGTLDRQMGEALGQLYVEQRFRPAAKARMDALVKNLMAAYRERIETREWMGPETKKQAQAKLQTIMTKIGYPDQWRDYTALQVGGDSYVENAQAAARFDWRYDLNKLGKPVDRTEWGMSAPTVNAYYNSSLNEIVFPAGILQPPFFNVEADDAVNYGGIGSVIGHEITHGFDDQGSRSDEYGNLRNWWTAADRANFTAKTEKLVKQYGDRVALDDLRINGRLTLGENIADLGGIKIAFAAYQKSLGGKPAPVIDGFTGPQRFFLGFAQVWRGGTREPEQRVRLRTDPHAPPRFRVLIPLSNIPEFYEAFGIKATDKMFRPAEERIEIW